MQVALHGGWKSAAVSQLIMYISHLLLQIQACKPNVWSHVPEMFVECAVCSFHALKLSSDDNQSQTTDTMAVLLSELLCDNKLVSPYMHDVVLQSVANLINNRVSLTVVQRNAAVVERLVPNLMRLYTQENWLPMTPIFMRIIGRNPTVKKALLQTGDSNAALSMDCPLCRCITRLCVQRSSAASAFINYLFSAMDWSATEVTVGLRDLSQGSRASSFTLRRRLVALFVLAVSTCDLLCYVIATVPMIFLSGPPVLASRLAEMVAFLTVNAPVDPSKATYQLLADVVAALGRQHICHPLMLAAHVASILGSCWEFERGPPDVYGARVAEARALVGPDAVPESPSNSVIGLIVGMEAACPTSALEALVRAPFARAELAEPELEALQAKIAHLEDLVEECKIRRAIARPTESACPQDFSDPIMMVPMSDPVRLPESGVIVDRVTIERHLLSNSMDPYSRTPLDIKDVVAQPELKARIEAWQAGQGSSREESHEQAVRSITSHVPQDWDLDSETLS
jgi:hypothetical protein